MLLTHAWAHALRATTTTATSTATAAAAGADAAAAAAAAFAYDARLPFSAAAAVCGVLYALTLVLHVNGVSSLAALLSGSSGSSSTGNSSSRSALEGVLEIPIRDFMSLVGAEHTVQEQTVKRS
jgi:3-oxoacyl-ACP reductase-like protein